MMRPPYFYPPNYAPMNYMPQQRISPFFMRQPIQQQPVLNVPIDPAAIPATLPAAIPPTQPPLTGFLANAQSLFNQAQQFTPYFQQAAPMLKNLPALWRMYRGFKGGDESSSVAAPRKKRKQHAPPASATHTTRPSVPKIYQPPYDF